MQDHISPRSRRSANQRSTFALCSSSVSANTCPPLPSATMNNALVVAGLSTASIDVRPGLVIGPFGKTGHCVCIIIIYRRYFRLSDAPAKRLSPRDRIDDCRICLKQHSFSDAI